jgi:succinate-semialdehyde dehydrogenase/glutarate-semialdehyde dehydrogenase
VTTERVPLLIDATSLGKPGPATWTEGMLIGGQWRSGSECPFPVANPATGDTVAYVADATISDAISAVDAAADSLKSWSETAPRARAELLARVHHLMLEDAERLASLITLENGKSLADARAEVTYAAEFFRWYGEEAVRPNGDFGSSPNGGTRTVVTHRPVGTAALVTPWNFPAAMATRKIAPALAAGCTVVLKPAAETPLTALAIARLIATAGVPDGVVNVVPTLNPESVVTAWLEDPRVRKLSFTGSTGVGRALLRQAADRVLNTSMELGGNNPFIVTGSADVGAAVDGAMVAKFRNGGQACTAANRFYVHESVAEEFVARFGARVETLRVGAASDGNDIGPLISAKALRGVRDLVDAAVDRGAVVSHRSAAPDGPGYFYPPTVLTGLDARDPLLDQEIFGPVAPIVVWRDLDDVLAAANGTESGLASYVYAELSEALRLGEALEAGMVGINRGLVSDPSAPFGGLKQSGIGREGGRDGLDEYLETQYLSVAW